MSGENSEGNILYKLGGLEALVTSSMSRIDQQITSLKEDINAKHTDMDKKLVAFGVRLDTVEDWKNSITVRISTITAAIFGIWAIFGEQIQHFLGSIF